MADQWARAGGSLWLDAILYDSTERDADTLLIPEPRPRVADSETGDAQAQG